MNIRVVLTHKGLKTVRDNISKGLQDDIEIRLSSYRTDDCIGIGCTLHNYFIDGSRYITIDVGDIDKLINSRNLFIEDSLITNMDGIVHLSATTTVKHNDFIWWMKTFIKRKYKIKDDILLTGFEPMHINGNIIVFTMKYIKYDNDVKNYIGVL